MQTDTDMFVRKLHVAGERVQPGHYKHIDSARLDGLESEDFLPANLDGRVARFVCVQRNGKEARGAVGASSACSVASIPTGLFCEVIGCFDEAGWILVLPQGISTEDCLCNHHHELLRIQNPDRASRYTHLSSLLTEARS
jgi:hypothetical protein